MPFPTPDFESGASTNSATSASFRNYNANCRRNSNLHIPARLMVILPQQSNAMTATAAAHIIHDDGKDNRAYSLSAIRVFCEVVRRDSFTHAAEYLQVTPSAVSQRIKQLETSVGCGLMSRRRGGIALTAEGRFLYEKLSRAMSDIDRAIAQIVSGQLGGSTVFGALSSFTAKWLIPRLHRFYRRHPDLPMIIRSYNHTIDVEREDVELAAINLPSAPASAALRSQLLWRETLFAVCSPAYLQDAARPLRTPDDLRFHTLLHDQTEIASKRNLDWHAWMRIAAPGQKINIRDGRLFTQSDLTLQAAIEGHGIAIARSSLAADDVRKGLLTDPLGIRVPVQSGCYLCARKEIWESPKIAALREWLTEEAASDIAMFQTAAN